MPNYCINSLVVEVNRNLLTDHVEGADDPTTLDIAVENAQQQLRDFMKRLSDGASEKETPYINGERPFFHLFVPVPKDCDVHVTCDKWGTKWDALGLDVCEEPNMVTLTFDSAWSPPTDFCEALSTQFPLLRIENTYDETGCAFYGTDAWLGGERIEECGGNMEFVEEQDVEPEEWEEFEATCEYPAKPGTAFADWCIETGRYSVYQPKKRARTSPEMLSKL